MMRRCPVTRGIRHRFDPGTHQCECGRWERGYAPGKVHSRPRGECQVCCRTISLDAGGNLGHHGYTRPGTGMIEGDCYGVGHKPYNATDALERYLEALTRHLAGRESWLANLAAAETLPYTCGGGRRGGEEVTTHVKRGEGRRQEGRHTIPAFDDLAEREARRAGLEIQRTREQIARVEKRIQDANPPQDPERRQAMSDPWAVPKRPIRHNSPDCWVFFREYDNPPLGLIPHLLRADTFERMRADAGLAEQDDRGEPLIAIGFDTYEEAVGALEKATLDRGEK